MSDVLGIGHKLNVAKIEYKMQKGENQKLHETTIFCMLCNKTYCLQDRFWWAHIEGWVYISKRDKRANKAEDKKRVWQRTMCY